MSFMFNPFPYNDPDAINRIDGAGIDMESGAFGNDAVAAAFQKLAGEPGVIALDGYAAAPLDAIADLFQGVEKIDLRTIFKTPEELNELLAENLPENRDQDPVLLFGRLFEGGYPGLFDEQKLAALIETLKAGGKTILLYGNGALCDELRPYADVKLFADVTPKKAVLNIKAGGYRNFGSTEELPFKTTMRRCYYVDFELSFSLRCKLLAEGALDYYLCADRPDALTLLPGALLDGLIRRALEYPIRCRPVYNEGVWGGYYVMNRRNLPETMKNCAWVFDLIPMEVSTVLVVDPPGGGTTREVELPFYALVAAHGETLMGRRCLEKFHGFFPIRFNYDDTFHAAGNMSIQLHPGEKFVRETYNELGRQDESYYIVVAGQGARTYLGFQDDVDPNDFVAAAKKSETEHVEVDYKKYIHSVKSEPGLQVMIPAGTIHASGRNQVVLEIGSLTVGSYTYKMYDYLRKDLDGKPRPIHSHYGERTLNHAMTGTEARARLVNGGRRVLREEEDGREIVVGECDELYFSLRNLVFGKSMTDDTNGDFHVLALVDGEEIEVRSRSNPDRSFILRYLDIIVVPAALGAYELINRKPGTRIVVHKTRLK